MQCRAQQSLRQRAFRSWAQPLALLIPGIRGCQLPPAHSLKTHSDSLHFGEGREPREVQRPIQSHSGNCVSPSAGPSSVPSATHHPASLPLPTVTSRPAGKSSLSQLALHLYIPECSSLGMCGSPSPACRVPGF